MLTNIATSHILCSIESEKRSAGDRSPTIFKFTGKSERRHTYLLRAIRGYIYHVSKQFRGDHFSRGDFGEPSAREEGRGGLAKRRAEGSAQVIGRRPNAERTSPSLRGPSTWLMVFASLLRVNSLSSVLCVPMNRRYRSLHIIHVHFASIFPAFRLLVTRLFEFSIRRVLQGWSIFTSARFSSLAYNSVFHASR